MGPANFGRRDAGSAPIMQRPGSGLIAIAAAPTISGRWASTAWGGSPITRVRAQLHVSERRDFSALQILPLVPGLCANRAMTVFTQRGICTAFSAIAARASRSRILLVRQSLPGTDFALSGRDA